MSLQKINEWHRIVKESVELVREIAYLHFTNGEPEARL